MLLYRFVYQSEKNYTALGPANYNCPMPCKNSTYGCCDDGITPAHGPNREGCCLSTQYKCCPDNILPARGPKFHGCGCQYTRFGCCPDNTTAARGPNNEGCGCKYTTHGCCPDRFTPATGPNYEGCSCYTYQFGCCPDGVTIAKGPHLQGCGCENTEFKCCSDGRTPAKGPNFAGCTCESSKYGCCADGVEEAQGENFEGCLSVPTSPGMACALERDRGSCRDFTVKWYFDTEYGGCSRFWYGGCEGNDNRFKTQEECKEVCVQPKGKDACFLPKISGPCEGYIPSWYYDTGRKMCGQFIWGGCLGNANKFKTREECEELCVTPDDLDPCEQPKEQGPCQGNFTKWYYNAESQACEQFQYGGCKGNDNNFVTEVACHQQCLQPGKTRDSCLLPRAEGNCGEKQSRWYFDPSENRCMPFYYTGCGGNKNNFESRAACETDCPTKIEQDTCLLPALLGECHNYTQRWYYDSYEQQCRLFYYGGCGGNENNFVNEQDCLNRCQTAITTPAPSKEVEFKLDFCFLPNEHGPCSGEHVKWFYDSQDGVCKQFRYGGCQSNGNNFNSREECEYRCGDVQDPCSLPKVIGPCNGVVRQYYYDYRTDTCEEFEYSGCQGNKNRFQSRSSCEEKCQKQVIPTQAVQNITITPTPSIETASKSSTCYMSVDPGSCNYDITAYYYDSQNHMCQAFIYGGCEGNANRFQTEEQCERLCGKFQGQDICNLPVAPGDCRGSFRKYYYDSVSRLCRDFSYSGCEGNANRFSTMTECESICIHHEEQAPPGNDTGVSNVSICKEPVDIGSCTSGTTKRFYYDEEQKTCRAFIYTGCGGNRNRFKTLESCISTCLIYTNEVDVDHDKDTKDICAEAREECSIIRCPYGKEAFVDSQDCERCRCVDPCRTQICAEGTKCAITVVASKDGTEYKGVCRSVTKPGRCPSVSNTSRCEQECLTDADCTGEMKCCNTACGASCLEPAVEEITSTPARPWITSSSDGLEPAQISKPEEPEVEAQEGGYATLKCIARGNPKPTITWRKGTILIGESESRRRILFDGSLQIVNLDRYDSGIYVCTADNGLGPPVRAEYKLIVTEPRELAAAIIGEANTHLTVTMNSPVSLHCYTYGWPKPFVTWWKGDRMLPLSSEMYEQGSEYSLLIRIVTLPTLGVYTCQAFNGIGRATSWSVTLQAIGPVYNVRPEYEKYIKYLVEAPKKPEKPQYPYRPDRTQTSDYQTYAPLTTTPKYSTHVTTVSPIGWSSTTDYGRKFRVPVKINITIGQTQFPEGSDVSIACYVDGYPSPRVQWFKDDVLIIPNNRIQISELNRLVISDANREDSGQYRCEASNNFSSAFSTVDIQVAGIFIHPNCQDNSFFAKCDLIVKARYCTHKYYAKFCCRSCTEAGQLQSRGPHLGNSRRRRRFIMKNLV
ncbi:Ppn [Anthophora quadrimaculata]